MYLARHRILIRAECCASKRDLRILKVAQSSGSDVFGGEECFGDDIIYRWTDRGTYCSPLFFFFSFFYFSEILHAGLTGSLR